MKMTRRLFILCLTLLTLLINEQCEASGRMGDDFDIMDPRKLAVCHDKLEQWNNVSTAAPESPALLASGNRSGDSYMRGKWKPMRGDSSSVVNPSFISGDHGTFLLYSQRIMGLVEGKGGPRIQNFSGNLFFHSKQNQLRGPHVAVAGVYNNDLGEACFVGCVQQPVQRYQALAPTTEVTPNGTNLRHAYKYTLQVSDEACIVRGLLTASREKGGRRKSASGALSSLRLPNETGYFTTMSLDGKIVYTKDQRNLYRWDLFVMFTIFAVEAVILMWQIFHSIRSPSSYFVSMLMILVQIVAMCCLYIFIILRPWRLYTLRRFKYLLSGVHVAPWLVLTVVILLNVVFLLVILRKRLVAKRLNVVERPQEVLLAVICLVIYALTGVGVWSAHNFETYVQLVWCWFLLPQVIANVVWDLRLKPLHWVYVVGVSLCRISYIGFNAARPTIYGFDDLDDFPHGWFWGITGTVSIFGSYALLQQHYGGRAFLPQRWFGYKQIPRSKGEANHQENNFDRDDDTMLEL